MALRTLKTTDITGKRVLMRADFNVPLKDGAITDDTRIRAALKSIQYILDQGASLVLMSHLGRPKGEKKPEFSLKPVADRLSELLDADVTMGDFCVLFLLAQRSRRNGASAPPSEGPPRK